MNRFLISIISGTLLVFGYFILLGVLYRLFHLSFETLAKLLIPLNLPYDIYKSIFGIYYGNKTLVKILNFAGAILIYSIPFYLALAIFDKFRKKTEIEKIENPPKPPTFEEF